MLAILRRRSSALTAAAATRTPSPPSSSSSSSPSTTAAALISRMSLSTRAASVASSSSPLLSTAQVQTLLSGGSASSSRVRLLDASWYLDKSRSGKQEFAAERLPGAAFFDIEAVADGASSLPHMLPPPADFARAMTALGVANDDTVVVYAGKNCFR